MLECAAAVLRALYLGIISEQLKTEINTSATKDSFAFHLSAAT